MFHTPLSSTLDVMKRLAHLNALRAFEISARVGSFAKAAEELCVTPAAVSQQVRLLEGYLGVALFHRHGSRLGTTEAAEHMLPDIAQGFERLTRGLQKAVEPGRRISQVRLAAPSSFVAKWLIPRLEVFRAEYPQIYLHICCVDRAGNHQENADLQVVQSAEWPNPSPTCVPLFTDTLFPVCSPKLQMQLDTRKGFQQLSDCILIHDNGIDPSTTCADWDRLLQSLDLPLSSSKKSIGFGDSLAATLAAREGLGILLGRHFVVEEDLRAGALVRPFESIHMPGPTYKAVLSDTREPRDEIIVLKNWLIAQARAYRDRAAAGQTRFVPPQSPPQIDFAPRNENQGALNLLAADALVSH
jgi:LysR family glycine cleavage system transcriptional activator